MEQKSVSPKILDLFRDELSTVSEKIYKDLLEWEKTLNPSVIHSILQNLHSLKGACRLVHWEKLVEIIHKIEGIFVDPASVSRETIDICFSFIDLLKPIYEASSFDFEQVYQEKIPDLEKIFEPSKKKSSKTGNNRSFSKDGNSLALSGIKMQPSQLKALASIAGEARVESAWLENFSQSWFYWRTHTFSLSTKLNRLYDIIISKNSTGSEILLKEILQEFALFDRNVHEKMADFELYIQRFQGISEKLYRHIFELRMRPFSESIPSLERLVRDVSLQLNKSVEICFSGIKTQVDREVLEHLDRILQLCITNSIDHGIEEVSLRQKRLKPEKGRIDVKLFEKRGILEVIIKDDGAGIDWDLLKKKILEKKPEQNILINKMSEEELLQFLLLPGFSTKNSPSLVSGRGIGLDKVHAEIAQMHGRISLRNHPGNGFEVIMHLPVTVSLIRVLLFLIKGDFYAIPLTRVEAVEVLNGNDINIIENKKYFKRNEKNVALFYLSNLFELEVEDDESDKMSVFILQRKIDGFEGEYGFVADLFCGEKDLVLQDIDPYLEKIPCVQSMALSEAGDVVYILSTEELLVAAERFDPLKKRFLSKTTDVLPPVILVVEDSITVREVEKRILEEKGYKVITARDGSDGWQILQTEKIDLIISDVDMPKMTGLELLRLVRESERHKKIPVMILSYKNRPEDRKIAVEFGVNVYLGKADFEDSSWLSQVEQLIPHEEV